MDRNIIRCAIRSGWSDEEIDKLEELYARLEQHSESDTIINRDIPIVNQEVKGGGQVSAEQADDLITIKEAASLTGYSGPSIRNWAHRNPTLLPMQRKDGKQHVNRYAVLEYAEKYGNPYQRAKGRMRVAKKHSSGLAWLDEWASIAETAKKTGIKQSVLKNWANGGSLTVMKFPGYSQILLNIRQVLSYRDTEIPVFVPDKDNFSREQYAPMKLVFRELGIPFEAILVRACSEACDRQKISNRKIGVLRIDHMPDVERWYSALE